eukprot:Phypoly_transcript_15239.p1 GENE.Phypoly_transcript_15239~~Phypoly_transcript_15239.p1  ORF type:complete len:261 (+),score=35.77 Phypoly_transcript_15239:70-852(+)
METTTENPEISERTAPLPLTRDLSDEEYLQLLTTEEREALAEFKKHPITEGFSDRRLVIYLFARKLKVDRAVTLLTNNLAFREKYEIPVHPTREHVNDQIYQARSTFYIPGATDKQGRAVHYLIPGRLVPSEFPVRDFMAYMVYLSDSTQWEHPEYHRHGVVVLEDLANCGMKNFDSRIMKKEKGQKSAVEDIFPGRIQAIYLINAPIIIKPLLAIAKLVMKKKIVKRVKIVSKKEHLLDYVHKGQLHEHFGGSLSHADI